MSRIASTTPRLTWAHAAAVAGAVGATLGLQVGVLRLSGVAVPFVLLGGSLLAVSAVHLLLLWGLGGRKRERPWCAALVLLPPLLALMPVLDGGTLGLAWVALAWLAASALVGWAFRATFVPSRPLASALLGAASGTAIAAGLWTGQLEAVPVVLSRWALLLLAASGLVALIGLAWSLPEGAAPLPPRRGSLALACGGLLLAAGLARPISQALPDPPKPLPRAAGGGAARPPVVLIVLDALRADHLAAYGYERDTMPNLERFARAYAVRIERSLANAPGSLESHGSMFTGLLPLRHGAHRPALHDPHPAEYAGPLRQDVPTLALLLQSAGYWTVGLAANYVQLAPSSGLGRGFSVYRAEPGWRQRPARLDPFRFALARRWPLALLDRFPPFRGSDFFELGTPYRRASEMISAAEAALEPAGGRPLFLFLNLMEAHAPYRAPRAFPRARQPGWKPLADDRKAADEVMAGKRREREGEREAWIDGYDSALRALDAALAPLLTRLAQHPRFAEMLVIVTSDHGEGFGEHGLYRHSTALYDEMLRVPLFLKPGARRPAGFEPGGSRPGPFQSVDLFPTVLDHAGVALPQGIDGRAWGRGRKASCAEAYAHAPSAPLGARFRRDQRAIEAGGWKLIASSDGSLELYDLARDPQESKNVAAGNPERVRALSAALQEALRAPGPSS